MMWSKCGIKKTEIHKNLPNINKREDFPGILKQLGLLGNWVELGVCKGHFSEHLLKNSSCKKLYSIDAWAGDRGHDNRQFLHTKGILAKYSDRSIIIRGKFVDASRIFLDNYFDFIYIDGYAHEGHIKILEAYWNKLRTGGLIAGHDYDGEFQLNMKQINSFFHSKNLSFLVTKEKRYPSYYCLKASRD